MLDKRGRKWGDWIQQEKRREEEEEEEEESMWWWWWCHYFRSPLTRTIHSLSFLDFFLFFIIIAFAPFNFRIHFTVVFSTVWPPQGACKVGKGGERVSNFLLMFELRKKLNKKFTIFIFICVFIMKIEQSVNIIIYINLWKFKLNHFK